MPQATAKAPSPVSTAPAPAATGVTQAVLPVPRTLSDIEAIRARRDELSNQLFSAQGRRADAAKQLRNPLTAGADRVGLEQRIQVLDTRIAQLETDIALTGNQLTSAPGPLLSQSTSTPFRGAPTSGQMTAITIVGTLFVLFPLSIAFARLLWRRATHHTPPQSMAPELTSRLDRMEQGIEAIAIEVERISEGQRFVAQLMSDTAQRPVREAAISPGTPASDRR
jgi:hypothetical protein